MSCLAETNPEFVAAARVALLSVEEKTDFTRETTFRFNNQEWWTKIRIDPHSNTVDKWDVFPANEYFQRW